MCSCSSARTAPATGRASPAPAPMPRSLWPKPPRAKSPRKPASAWAARGCRRRLARLEHPDRFRDLPDLAPPLRTRGRVRNQEHWFSLLVPRDLEDPPSVRASICAIAGCLGARPPSLLFSLQRRGDPSVAGPELSALPAIIAVLRHPPSIRPTGCGSRPTTSTRACAGSGRASAWRSTTSSSASRRSTPIWCSCRRCDRSIARRPGTSPTPTPAGRGCRRPNTWLPRATRWRTTRTP